ncbi:Di-copper centre-containing protein [Pluteus cervinus]|uniref:Di-copper centre-containing protein n=1 Tax=Pluteus cervinus TaxID=181527 RepID=A0ACD3AYU9_9AGAR|nr:Di-copper centre-containing protein [Pluteus cervinus]
MRVPTLISSVFLAVTLVGALPATPTPTPAPAQVEARDLCTLLNSLLGLCTLLGITSSSSTHTSTTHTSTSTSTPPPTTTSTSTATPTPSTCTQPAQRAEWRTFTATQKATFLTAVKCLASKPHWSQLQQNNTGPDIPPMDTSGSLYDDFVWIHIDFNHHIHSTAWFFPWHRWYLNLYVRALNTQCGYSGNLPYWDWTQDAADFEHATIWDGDSSSGVGTWGDPNQDYQIVDGAWGLNQAQPFYINYPIHHAIRRQFTLQPYENFHYGYLISDPTLNANETFTQARVDEAVTSHDGDFQGFQTDFQNYQGPHAGVHLITGGDLTGLCPTAAQNCVPGETWSPNDPMFFMHHAMVDRIWWQWQSRANNKLLFGGGSDQVLDSLSDYEEYPLGNGTPLNFSSIIPTDGLNYLDTKTNVAIGDVMDIQGGYLCYEYV